MNGQVSDLTMLHLRLNSKNHGGLYRFVKKKKKKNEKKRRVWQQVVGKKKDRIKIYVISTNKHKQLQPEYHSGLVQLRP